MVDCIEMQQSSYKNFSWLSKTIHDLFNVSFQQNILLVQLQLLNFIIFYILWPSCIATKYTIQCDLKCVLIKYAEMVLFTMQGMRGASYVAIV